MKLSGIFVNELMQGIHSICYEDNGISEFGRLLNLWDSPGYVRDYCKENISYLESGFYGSTTTLEAIVMEIMKEAGEIESLLFNTSAKKLSGSSNRLNEIFKPLVNTQYKKDEELRLDKLRIKNKHFKKSKLRIYAIKLDEFTWVITGGAIKFTEQMKEHKDTAKELEKIKRVRDWLKENEIFTNDDLIYYYETK